MFELTRQSAVFANYNPRTEQHGEDKEPASDLKFSVNVSSEPLAYFAPTLRWSLFHKAGNGGDLANQTHDASNLRYPKMGAFKWDHEIVGAVVSVAHGLGGKSDLVFENATVNAFNIEPQEGGTVIIAFRVQCQPDERQAGKLYLLQGETVELTVTPPAVDDDILDADKPLNTAGDAAPKRGRGRKSRTAELV